MLEFDIHFRVRLVTACGNINIVQFKLAINACGDMAAIVLADTLVDFQLVQRQLR